MQALIHLVMDVPGAVGRVSIGADGAQPEYEFEHTRHVRLGRGS